MRFTSSWVVGWSDFTLAYADFKGHHNLQTVLKFKLCLVLLVKSDH